MADPMAADPILPNPNDTADEFDDDLPIPPLDPLFFSEDYTFADNFLSFENEDVEDFDFTFDDDDVEDFLNSTFPPVHHSSDPNSDAIPPIQTSSGSHGLHSNSPESDQVSGVRSSDFAEFLNIPLSCSGDFYQNSGNRPSDASGILNCPSPDVANFSTDRRSDVAGNLKARSLESGDCSEKSSNNSSVVSRVLKSKSPELVQISGDRSSDADDVLNCPSPELGSSQGSGNFGSEALNCPSPDSDNCARSFASSPNSGINIRNGVVDQQIKLEEMGNHCVLKRKKVNEDVNSSEATTNKHRKSNTVENANQSYGFNATKDEEVKKKARLMRNRESAQLSRQRKKHYVEELEDKVRTMHSTIQDLNAKISYVVAENASLRQQLGGVGHVCPPQVPPPGMYPHPPMAPMGYPWMPCPPYVVKPQGSQVPLVPIPRLKPQSSVSATKARKGEIKKSEGKTKKVAGVSFLGLLFFIMLFGGLVPMVNVKYGGVREAMLGGSDYIGNRFFDHHHGRVLMVNDHLDGTKHNIGMGFSNDKFDVGRNFTSSLGCGRGNVGVAEAKVEQKDDFVSSGNGSEPLVASLFVPRNDKLVKIDGNLIIHSVLASEKAKASREEPEMKSGRETSLAVALNMGPGISIPGVGMNNGRHPHVYRSMAERQRALASDKDKLKSKVADGKLQQWFREGLAGPMLSSGMCTEVFQFDVSPASAPGAIIPATSVRNISAEQGQNSTHVNKGRNRRILHGLPIPLPGSTNNISKEHVGSNSQKENSPGNNSLSSMVVSVLVDPREAGDGDGDGMMGTKSLSRIFVVVLIDSVKYVTYSCILPFMGSGHLVTT